MRVYGELAQLQEAKPLVVGLESRLEYRLESRLEYRLESSCVVRKGLNVPGIMTLFKWYVTDCVTL